MLRRNSPFAVASVGGMVALLGDKLWLAYDWLLKPVNDVVPHAAVYAFIGATFLAGMALIAWSVVLHARNGHALQEIRQEIQHRRSVARRRRFRKIAMAGGGS